MEQEKKQSINSRANKNEFKIVMICKRKRKRSYAVRVNMIFDFLRLKYRVRSEKKKNKTKTLHIAHFHVNASAHVSHTIPYLAMPKKLFVKTKSEREKKNVTIEANINSFRANCALNRSINIYV